MSVTVSTLGNGLRVVSHRLDHLETVSLGVWVGCGSGSEAASQSGISHFLEHMAFKGTERRSARQIAEEIEDVGGDLNAATSIETTAFYARVLKDDVGVAMDILGDIVRNARLDERELERERDVILQEIAASRDNPDEVIHDVAQALAFPDQGIGRPVLGTAESVAGLDCAALERFLNAHYKAGSLVIAAAGAIDHDLLHRHAEAQFGDMMSGRGPERATAVYVGGYAQVNRWFEQTHLLLAFEGPAYTADEFFAGQVLSGVLGGGMSSRLFQEAREARGLCYSIYSFAWGMADCGFFGIHAATGAEQADELRRVVTGQLRGIAEYGPDAGELQRAKAQIRVGLAVALESTGARAEQLARQLLGYGRTVDIEELIAKVDAVGVDDVRELCARLAAQPRPTWVRLSVPGEGDYDRLREELSGSSVY